METPQAGIPLEVVAAITAALSATLEQPVGYFAIRSIQPVGLPVGPAPSAWGKTGVLESHLARRQFGLRSR